MAGPDRRPGRPAPMRVGPRRPVLGIALVLVLWVLTLLTVMALGMTAAQRTETSLADNHIAGARFLALTDGAIAYAMLSFLLPANEGVEAEAASFGDADPALPGPWVPDGTPRPWWLDGELVNISVFNESSRIDLNQAQPELLTALLMVLDVQEAEARSLADAIVDFRDEDDLRLLNGAEDGDYQDQGRRLGAKDAPFAAVEELQQVLGMDRDLYLRVATELTVDGQGDQVDQTFASPAVLAALQGIPLEEAELQVQERDNPLLEGTQGPRAVNRGGPLYRIRIEESGSGPGRIMEALVEMTPGQSPPYLIRWRRFGLVSSPSPPSDSGLMADGS